MMWWILLTVFVGATLVVLRLAKGPAYTLETLGGPIRGLLKQGYNGGFLLIDVARSQKFVQLRKYIEKPGIYGIELGFPRAHWSEPYYEKLKSVCESDRIRYREDRGGASDPLDFLFVDFGKDATAATEFVRRVFTDVMNVPIGRRFYCRLENATPEDRLIDA